MCKMIGETILYQNKDFDSAPLHEAGNPDDFGRQAWLSPSSAGGRVQYMERGKQSYKHEGFARAIGTIEFPFG